jgi:hypothetical protein
MTGDGQCCSIDQVYYQNNKSYCCPTGFYGAYYNDNLGGYTTCCSYENICFNKDSGDYECCSTGQECTINGCGGINSSQCRQDTCTTGTACAHDGCCPIERYCNGNCCPNGGVCSYSLSKGIYCHT